MRRRVMLSGLCLSALAPTAASALSPSTFMVFFPAGSVKPYPQAETTLAHCVKAYRNRLPQEANVEIYGHMKYYNVKAGDVVSAGDQIAKVGNQGQSTGPHLHFEIHAGGLNGKPTDPAKWLADRGLRMGAMGALTKPIKTKEALDETFARMRRFMEPRVKSLLAEVPPDGWHRPNRGAAARCRSA